MTSRDCPHLKAKIREIIDFPTAGIKFKDITPLLEDKVAFRETIDCFSDFFRDSRADKIVGIDARGFLLAAPVAYILNTGMVIVRKKGKLPYAKILREHDLEYGRGSLEIHVDAIKRGERILIIDDVLATGGTAEAAVKLVEDLGGHVIGLGFLLELSMNGRELLKNYEIKSLLKY